ncbi:hypothetical protein FRC06_011871 [Ceratobasidium sp. 370]|nr:hypothetical protein FRC06_011871 [Ceratobasidium sp. 370]
MGEVLTRREEVAAKRAALTDGRWRNREGIGMYQRSTSNALREMLSDLKPAQPAQPSKSRARTKSRSRSRSPKKRKSIAEPVPQAGPSRVQTGSVPEEDPVSKSPIQAPPSRRPSSTSAPPQSLLSPALRLKPVSGAKPKSIPDTKPPPKPKSRQEASRNDHSEPEMTVANLLKQRRAKLTEEESQQATANLGGDDEEAPVEEEDASMEVAGPSTEPIAKKVPAAKTKPRMEQMEDSVVVFQEDQEEEERPNPPKAKPKNRIQTIIPESVQPVKSKPKKRIEDPEHNAKPAVKSKGKAPRGKKKVAEDGGESDEEVVVRKVSAGKRPAHSDDEDEGSDDLLSAKGNSGPSTSRRTKTKPNPPRKPKAKTKAKSKPRKREKSASTSASTSRSYRSALESPELPEPRDIMVPLQDSPRPKSKLNRRRYTLMPVRSEAEMADPDYDPMDCIGFGFAAAS